MRLFSFCHCAIVFASFSFISNSLTIPNDQRKALGLPLIDTQSTNHNHGLFRPQHQPADGPKDEHFVTLEARRGRGGSSGRSRAKPQRKKPHKGKKTRKPKKSPKRKSKNGKQSKAHGAQKSKPIKPKPTKSKSTKIVWPTPSVSHPKTAINPCGLYIDCDIDDAASEISARAIEEFSVDLGIANASARTRATTFNEISKRDIRTQIARLGTEGDLSIKNLNYPSSGQLFKKQPPKYHRAFHFENANADDPDVLGSKTPKKNVEYATEHIVELQSIGRFLRTVTEGPGAKKKALAKWLKKNWKAKLTTASVNKRKKPTPDYKLYGDLLFGNLIWNALGSNTNLQDFVLCDVQINSFKARIWKLDPPMRAVKFQDLVDKSIQGAAHSNEYLTALKMTFGVFQYMNNAIVTKNMRHAIRNVEIEFGNARNIIARAPLSPGINLGAEWKKFIQEHLEEASEKAKVWVTTHIKLTEGKINAELKVLKRTLTTLQANEKKGTPAYKQKQNTERNKLGNQMIKLGKEIAKMEKEMKALEMKQKASTGPARKKIKDQVVAKRGALLKKTRARGMAERKRALLYSGSVRKVIQGFEDDKKVLAGYKKMANAYLKMPKAY